MSSIAQSNLRGMVGEILSWNPDFPPWMAIQSVNNWMRKLIDRRTWAGLLVQSQIIVPDQYSTGTVTVTQGSATVTGAGTSWPISDLVNTTVAVAITETAILIDVTPTSMAGIGLGDWLTLGANTASEEQVLVVSLTTDTFRTICSKTHIVGVAITKSSLVRRQFRVSETVPWYSVKGVSTSTSLVLDDVFGGPTTVASNYSIFQGYVTFGNDCKFVMEVANLNRRYRLSLHMPQAAIMAYDPQRAATESTYTLLDLTPDEIGRPRYEWYPRPTSAQVFACLYYRQVPNLEDDEDTPPPFIASDVLVSAAIADALRYRPKMNPHYSESMANQIATQKMNEFELRAAQLGVADDGVYMNAIRWNFGAWRVWGGGDTQFGQSHDWDQLVGNI
jgi:hypothetical protein